MKDSIRAILGAAGGYTAAVIGAGFASGQEIVCFFVSRGIYGFAGIITACALLSVFAGALMSFCIKRGVYSYSDFLSLIFPSPFMKNTAKAVVFVCSAASLCVMTACAGELFKAALSVPTFAGAFIFAAVCGIILIMDARKITGINSVLGGVIIIGIIFICFYILRFREHQTFSPLLGGAAQGAAYAGYNVIGAGAVLAQMSRSMRSKADAYLAAAVSGAALCIMITLIWGVLGIYYGKINLGEIPMLTMALRQGRAAGVFYGIMLALAVLTTGISNGFAVVDITGKMLPRTAAVFMTVFAALCMSGAGFSTLIDTLYRFCGYAGMIIAAVIVGKSVKEAKKQENKRK